MPTTTTEPAAETLPLNGERLPSFAAIWRRGILPLNPATIFRAAPKGVRVGGEVVRLEAVRCGRRWFTSAEAAARWVAACTGNPDASPAPAPPSRPARRRAQSEAAEELDRLGVR